MLQKLFSMARNVLIVILISLSVGLFTESLKWTRNIYVQNVLNKTSTELLDTILNKKESMSPNYKSIREDEPLPDTAINLDPDTSIIKQPPIREPGEDSWIKRFGIQLPPEEPKVEKIAQRKYSQDFEKASAIILSIEKGYKKWSKSLGGETKYGISKKQYPNIDIKNLTIEQAKDIMYRDYWVKSGAHKMKWPNNLIHFDTSYLLGVSKANKFNREAVDLSHYMELRDADLKSQNRKGVIEGWLNRSQALREIAEIPSQDVQDAPGSTKEQESIGTYTPLQEDLGTFIPLPQ